MHKTQLVTEVTDDSLTFFFYIPTSMTRQIDLILSDHRINSFCQLNETLHHNARTMSSYARATLAGIAVNNGV